MNLEQASKVKVWMPTRPICGEGRCRQGRKPIDALVLVHRGNEDGMSGKYLMQRGRPVPDGGKAPYFWHASEGDKEGRLALLPEDFPVIGNFQMKLIP